MKSNRKVLEFNVPSRLAFINITEQVQSALEESGIREGLCQRYCQEPYPTLNLFPFHFQSGPLLLKLLDFPPVWNSPFDCLLECRLITKHADQSNCHGVLKLIRRDPMLN